MNGWCGLQPAEVDLRLARTENTHTQNKKTKTVNTHSCTLLLLPLLDGSISLSVPGT